MEITNSFARSTSIKDFITLMKPTVTLLVVISGVAGLILAKTQIDLSTALISITCIALGSGGAAAFNMWYDQDIDSIMPRTQNRPIVRGAISSEEAGIFSFTLSLISVVLMAFFVNLKASILLLFSILFYTLIYTVWLKRSTYYNIVIGGIAGSLPPVIGWFCATDSISSTPWIIFLLIFFWTPAHFWALAIARYEDYKLCNVPMLPVVKGIKRTKIEILLYTIATVAISFVPYFMGFASWLYLIVTFMCGIKFIYSAFLLFKSLDTKRTCYEFFLFSIVYMFLLLLALIVDQYIPL